MARLGMPDLSGGRRGHVPVSLFLVLSVAALGLSGCGVVKAIEHHVENKVLNAVTGHNKVMNNFTTKINTNINAAYEATYVTTGSAPATITFATSPPKDFFFEGGSSTGRLLQNSTGSYTCLKSTSGGWSCTKLSASTFDTAKVAYALYSGKYWVTFLRIYSTVAGLAGVTIKASSMTVNGFPLSCVVVNGGKQNPGTSTWCETSTGILAYVQAAANGTAFELKSYSANPPSSLFDLPAGATVNTIPSTPTST
ncbi:MAG TPA: hypothetical protein VIJ34_07205 [Acidimicrobiales bacterium]